MSEAEGRLAGKRKFYIAILALTMGFVLTLVGKMTGAEFVTNSGLVVGLIGGANAMVHVAKARTHSPPPPE